MIEGMQREGTRTAPAPLGLSGLLHGRLVAVDEENNVRELRSGSNGRRQIAGPGRGFSDLCRDSAAGHLDLGRVGRHSRHGEGQRLHMHAI